MEGHLPASLWWIGLFGGIGAFIDFLIGRAGQDRARRFLETWWIRFDDVRWDNFGRKEAESAVGLIDRWCGRRLFSVRRLVFVLAFFAVASLIGHLIAMLTRLELFLPAKPTFTLYPYIISESVGFAAALSFTRLISVIAIRLSSDSLLKNAATFTSLLLISYVALLLWLPLMQLTGIFPWIFLPIANGLPVTQVLGHLGDWLGLYWGAVWKNYDPTLWPIAAITKIYDEFADGLRPEAVAANKLSLYWYWHDFVKLSQIYFPSIIRIAMAMTFVGSFIAQPLVMRPFSLIWRRVVESDKPIFTLVFGGIAAGAVLVSVISKHL